MIPLIRHYVQGVGYVKCNQKPYQAKDGTKRFWGKEEFTCIFCDERKKAKEEIEAKAAAENRKVSVDEGKFLANLHKRHIQLAAPAIVEVKEKSKVVKEAEAKAILFKAQDMFFSHLTQNYSTLISIYNTKGTLKDYWYTMDGKGTIMQDDKLTKEEKEVAFEVDMAYFEASTKDYKTGFNKYTEKKEAVELAEPIEEYEEAVEDVF